MGLEVIIGTYFKGDNNEHVKDLQHDHYGDLISALFTHCRDEYIRACVIIDNRTELYGLLKKKGSIDHRTLQLVHDLIAANFRWDCAQQIQPMLPFDKKDDTNRILKMWNDFFWHEVCSLTEDYLHFVKLITQAVCYPNPDKRGILSEEHLFEILSGRYEYFLDDKYIVL